MGVAALLCATVLVSGSCGTRMSRQQLIEGAGGGLTAVTSVGATGGSQIGVGSVSTGAGGPAVRGVSPGVTTGGASQARGSSGSSRTGTGGGVSGGQPGPGSGTSGATAPGSAVGPAGGGCASANHTPVVIGSVGTYSGVLGANLAPAPPTLEAWAKYVNARGGVACHPVQVYTVDDQGSTDRANSATQDLVQNKHAVALVGSFIPNTASGVQAYVDPHRIPVVGGDGFTPWDSDPMLFNEGSNIDTQVYATEKYSAQIGKPKWAVLYCGESSVCSNGKNLASKYAASAGVTIVDTEQVSVAQPNFTANCLNAQSKGAQVIYNINDASSMYRVADDCANQSYHPLISTAAASMTSQQTSDPNLEGLFGTNADAPWMLGSTPALQAYQQAMATYAPSLTLTGITIMTWTSAELFRSAVENMGAAATSGPITTQTVLQGLWKIQHQTLGGLTPQSLNFRQRQPGAPVKCAFITAIKGSKWTAPIGLTQICRP
jgi:branched-chain amino acid transport system substrate-binding protein